MPRGARLQDAHSWGSIRKAERWLKLYAVEPAGLPLTRSMIADRGVRHA